eukprot:14182501-Alexandrium_andersonii.AAC.1
MWVSAGWFVTVFVATSVAAGSVDDAIAQDRQHYQSTAGAGARHWPKPNTDLKAAVRRAHVNMGHPPKDVFVRILQKGHASDAAIEEAKKL